MLMELLEDFKIVNSVGEDIGKIKEVYFDIGKWNVSGFEISPGFFKKDTLLETKDILEIRYDDKKIIVKDDFEGSELPKDPNKGLFPFNELSKRQVVDNQGEKVGKIYNMEIPYEKLKNLKVWKVLIRTGFKDRRLRLNPHDISEVMEEIKLLKTIDEIEAKMD